MVGRTMVATATSAPRPRTAPMETSRGGLAANTSTPTAAIAAIASDATPSVRIVPAAMNCNGSSITSAPATSPAIKPMSRHPTSTIVITVNTLRVAWIGLIAHSLSVTHRMAPRNAG
jgi:hypothetical protein